MEHEYIVFRPGVPPSVADPDVIKIMVELELITHEVSYYNFGTKTFTHHFVVL